MLPGPWITTPKRLCRPGAGDFVLLPQVRETIFMLLCNLPGSSGIGHGDHAEDIIQHDKRLETMH
jgi:hypothetical protein